MKEQIIFLFILLQGCVGQQSKFNFPSRIQALLGSCVEIPCSVTPAPKDLENLKVVWHVIRAFRPSSIIYSTRQDEISAKYENQAALKDMCTLRIHHVKKQDERSYYPNSSKNIRARVDKYVELKVTDVPPESVLSVPEEMTVGEPTKITCSANHTCASSPPYFTWSLTGLHTEYNVDLGEGKWKALSELTYQPSEAGNGSEIQCTVSFLNGQASHKTATLNIKMGPQTNIYLYIGTAFGIICAIAILVIIFFIWRKKRCFKRNTFKGSLDRKLDSKDNLSSKTSAKYTDLLERDHASYYTLEPTANHPMPGNRDKHLPLP
ncbi:Schwann cell myelin protein-like isoform X1 [Mixophyes fleayi]|uniref:Schwann cell myelin protein-like isoform X1 n=1 Tax=Mixophyes fleayi TaxID=3061075 RepID=UPI003F4E12F6